MSIKIEENVALASMTTMRTGGTARFFMRVASVDDLKSALFFAKENSLPIFILGGGANTVVSDNGFPGLVIKIEIKGIKHSDGFVTAGAGEWWDNVVSLAVEKNLVGIENLSFIPASVGGAVVQNIGAYGAELKDSIFSVEVLNREKMKTETFTLKDCEFGYRESLFKKNKNFIVLRATFKLEQNGKPNSSYEEVKKYFEDKNINTPSLIEVREAIIDIRNAKLPKSPLGSAGSFFKNPIVSLSVFEKLKKQFPEIVAYPQDDNTVKISAAWLIDKVGGWRGVRKGDVGVHDKQALILVNYGSATAEEVLDFAQEIKNDIKNKTGVTLEEEVVVIKK